MSGDYYDYHPTVQLDRSIVLGGVPSAPYREVGHYLATLSGLTLVDLDRWLEHQVGTSLWDFVQAEGEDVLRRKESEYLERALNAHPHCLIIVGEGTLAQQENCRRIGEAAALVYLSLTPTSVYWQVRQQISERGPRYHPHIPQPLTHYQQLRPLFAALEGAEKAADRVVAMDHCSVQDAIDLLLEALPTLGKRRGSAQ